ncbi:MAG TPA: PEGA domain-containing protein [Vicinamibacterales bacterium]|nr:PEGA domain-containing protein [Vicinamibacterales bacterium]
MTRIKQLSFIAVVVALMVGLWPNDAFAQRRRLRVTRPVVYSRVYVGPHYPYYGYYWSPWYGGWPWWYGPYWDGPYYRRYYAEPTGALRVQVSPRNTQVYVDGYFVGIADDFDGVFQRLRVPPGGHEIVLHLPGYRNATQTLYLQPGSTYHLKHEMQPLPAGAPDDPLPRPNPNAVEAPRGTEEEPAMREREPANREPMERRYPPRPPRDPGESTRESRFGSVAIRVQPADAVVVVDGTEWRGAADERGEILIQLAAGRHRIEVRREGYESYSTEVDVRPGVTTPVNVLLPAREQ